MFCILRLVGCWILIQVKIGSFLAVDSLMVILSCFGVGVQKLAEHYIEGAHFLKFYGNSNDNTKSMFKNRFNVTVTPSFFFFKNGDSPRLCVLMTTNCSVFPMLC